LSIRRRLAESRDRLRGNGADGPCRARLTSPHFWELVREVGGLRNLQNIDNCWGIDGMPIDVIAEIEVVPEP